MRGMEEDDVWEAYYKLKAQYGEKNLIAPFKDGPYWKIGVCPEGYYIEYFVCIDCKRKHYFNGQTTNWTYWRWEF